VRVAVVGSGFAGSLLARVLAVQGTTSCCSSAAPIRASRSGSRAPPLANLTLERLARRYGLDDCYDLAAHGRWVARFRSSAAG